MFRALLLLYTLFPLLLTAQSGRLDVFRPGTQVTYYESGCGTVPAEAAGKLNWCPEYPYGPQAVVTRSTGLSGNRVTGAYPNYFNDAEIFGTDEGISIRKADGTFENVPYDALGLISRYTNAPSILDGWVRPDGVFVFIPSPVDYYKDRDVFLYNLVTKESTTIAVSDRSNYEAFMPKYLVGNPTTGTTYIAAHHDDFFTSREQIFHLHASGAIYTSDYDLPANTVSQDYLPVGEMVLINGTAYIGSAYGISAYDYYGNPVADYGTALGLTYGADVSALVAAPDGYLWLAARQPTGSRLIRLNPADSTYQSFTTNVPGTGTPLLFTDLAVLDNGDVTAVAENYAGVIDLAWQQSNPGWTFRSLADLSQLAPPVTHGPVSVTREHGRIYYAVDNSAGVRDRGADILVRAGQQWSSVNDDGTAGAAVSDLRQFDQLESDGRGGVYAISNEHDIIGRMDASGTMQRFDNGRGIHSPPAVYAGDQLAYVNQRSWLSRWTSTDFSSTQSLPSDIARSDLASNYGRALTFFQPQQGLYRRYLNGTLLGRHPLDPSLDYSSYTKFVSDRDGNAWLARNNKSYRLPLAGNSPVVRYDLARGTTVPLSAPYVGTLQELLAAPAGGVYLVGTQGVAYLNGNTTKSFTSSDHGSMTKIIAAAVDSRGSLHLLRSDHQVMRLDDLPTSPSLTNLYGNQDYAAFEVNYWSDITVDTNGDTWVSAANRLFRFGGYTSSPGYLNTSTKFTVSGFVYSDRNKNGRPDPGEGIAKQSVQLTVGKTVSTTYTDATGRYRFPLSRANTVYDLSTSAGTTSPALRGSVPVYDTQRPYAGPDFLYKRTLSFAKQTSTPPSAASQDLRVKVYPNPATEFIVVESNDVADYIRLMDVNGRIVAEARPTDTHHRLPTTQLPAGAYVLRVDADGESHPRKIIIR
ncbi:T9SS type A sorting domain-containing protein [Lewinella sp. IMCC34191]|uniref:T9SS type A sorting domain-containing protein n=1 Tax=Lewinella sp. IMCC34191 TaxID=2259172 RepID=UPI000E236233|nr:T9SS type A sorting domain-containing protein [Lewinella sp. IMCC34191]